LKNKNTCNAFAFFVPTFFYRGKGVPGLFSRFDCAAATKSGAFGGACALFRCAAGTA
jgi:hypothetical protein